MKLHEIELWARRVLQRLEANGQGEDSLVELKAKWPEPRWTARQLAAHANAARGANILWLIGVDEKRGAVGADDAECGDWLSQIRGEFDGGVSPALLGQVTLDHDGFNVVGLAFGTNRPPYVIRNPARGTDKSGPFSLEVPWRDGSSTRSAGRLELLLLLSESVSVPTADMRFAAISAATVIKATSFPAGRNTPRELLGTKWHVQCDLYITHTARGTVVVPFHRSRVTLTGHGLSEPLEFTRAQFEVPKRHGNQGAVSHSLTIETTATEMLIHGPGSVTMTCSGVEDHVYDHVIDGSLDLSAELSVAGQALPIVLHTVVLPRAIATQAGGGPREEVVGKWELRA